MKKFSKFYFKSFKFDKNSLLAKFNYSFDNDVFFTEIIDFSSNLFVTRDNIDSKITNNILFHLHIALGISYYKAFPTNDLIVESGILDDYQIGFWKKFYSNGLGEFLYTNKISPNGLFNFINNSNKKYRKEIFKVSDKSLVPVGGGKDSIVSIELLKNAGINFDLFVFGKDDFLKTSTSNISGNNILLIKRKISDNLFNLNKLGYYNGHVPITGLIAFVMVTVGYLYNYKYLILSNEISANFSNTLWNYININHQYSKSLEFEIDFRDYVSKYISDDIKYFSLLRGMYEVKIAEYFSKFGKEYFSKFSSCNNNFKILNKSDKIKKGKHWCNNCPKCAFVFAILRPYIDNNDVITIFGEDLFENKELETLYRELLGITGIKPFECVGEAEEVIYSMYKSLEKYNKLPYILEIFKKEVLKKFKKYDLEKLEKKLGNIYDEDIIPKEIKKLVFNNN
ncbi:hypothetical protein LRZ95_00820 [Candidatus Gracilibacteria bacterium]|nr:hypothetical protein [Candidatus Gracilibacteria bacterium]